MVHSVLMGEPTHFHIRAGWNPHTRDRWGRRKRVDLQRAIQQWGILKDTLEAHDVRVHLLPTVPDQPGLVFPANAGFRYGDTIFLSNLNPGRQGEKEYYRRKFEELGVKTQGFPVDLPFEGEADFIAVGDPSGDSEKTLYLFTYGQVNPPRWVPRLGIPPYRWHFGFRSDRRALPFLQDLVKPREVLPLELIDPAHYHGDTVLCPFGPKGEYLLAYLKGLAPASQRSLLARLGERVIPLNEEDGQRFAANSFPISTVYYGEKVNLLVTPDGLSVDFYQKIRSLGVVPCPVDVSEFLEKGGGAVKCLLFNLGEA